MQPQKWNLVVIDLKFNRMYVLIPDQSRAACDQIVRDWSEQKLPDHVPVIWPADRSLPVSILAA